MYLNISVIQTPLCPSVFGDVTSYCGVFILCTIAFTLYTLEYLDLP